MKRKGCQWGSSSEQENFEVPYQRRTSTLPVQKYKLRCAGNHAARTQTKCLHPNVTPSGARKASASLMLTCPTEQQQACYHRRGTSAVQNQNQQIPHPHSHLHAGLQIVTKVLLLSPYSLSKYIRSSRQCVTISTTVPCSVSPLEPSFRPALA